MTFDIRSIASKFKLTPDTREVSGTTPPVEQQSPGPAAPEGLTARGGSNGPSAPRQPLVALQQPVGQALADAETLGAVAAQQRQSANSAALAMSMAAAASAQAISEHMKSMAEMRAKSIKSAGEALKGLA